MSDVNTSTPAAPNFERLKAKLRELFELDKADLDFGIYRILRQRHAEITAFLDNHLEQTVRSALTAHGDVQNLQLKQELVVAEEQARALGITPEQSPKVMELRAQYKTGADLDAVADEVYSHLYTFFARYYQEGDFLGLPRSTVQGREKYMIPYNGEEVKLVWANMDQYYIKSSELLRDYTFRIRRAELGGAQLSLLQASDDEPAEVVIHFKLVEGDTEKDNRKPDGKTTRVFALEGEQPFVETDAATLTLRFCYREQATEPNLQRKLNDLTEQTLAATLPAKWQPLLLAADPTYKGKDNRDTRTILQKHLRGYTARHQFDYFIHKDLGGFLRRELDFYIKNEVMHLDDIEGLAAPKAEEYLSKIRALRRCALPVIRMVAQLEEFQKKLWLKKKFVVETRYCLTLDRVPTALYEAICANDAQWAEWEQLYALSAIEANLLTAPLRTPAFLHQQPHLMLDTRHFDRDFTLRLLASIDNLDETLDGVCFHAENFQALQLMQERYREQVKCVYTDPPYNTGTDGFPYKDGFQHSSWLSMVSDRFQIARAFLCKDGSLFVNIDKNEQIKLIHVLSIIFGEENRIEEMIWAQNTTHSDSPTYSTNHEYIEVFARKRSEVERDFVTYREAKPGFKEITELITELNPKYLPISEIEKAIKSCMAKHLEEFKIELAELRLEYNEETKKLDTWRGIYPYANAEYRSGSGQYVDEKEAAQTSAFIWVWSESDLSMPAGKQSETTRDPSHPNYRFYRPIHPLTQRECPFPKRGWGLPKEDLEGRQSFESLASDHRIVFGLDEAKVPRYKRFLHDVKTNVSKSFFHDYNDGEKEVYELIGKSSAFPNPKPATLALRFIEQANTRSQTVLDFFAGSGTTGHAVINLNRNEENSARKYILVEMGEHFNTVLVPRLKKVVYATDWRDGKPQSRDTGLSHAFKIVRLESYEDTLNNLCLRRTPAQAAALRQATDEQRAEYMLGYFLDVESTGSASLLDVEQFRNPFAYQLQIATASAGETQATTVDLLETFNWLLGLQVKQIDAQRGFVTVTGVQRAGGRTLIIWRTLSADPAADNLALEKYLARLAINPADTEYDFIYVNGSHTLADPHKKIHLIEEVFQRRMFVDPGVGL